MNPSHTKETWSLYMREYRKRNPAKMKAIDLKKRFGISLEQYAALLEEQDHVCKICGNAEKSVDHRTKQVRQLAVDHCHTKGHVRGLLCSDCNTAIGLLRDDPELLRKAAKYVEATSTPLIGLGTSVPFLLT